MPRISGLQQASTIADDDQLPIRDVSANSTRRITFAAFRSWLQGIASWITAAMINDGEVIKASDVVMFMAYKTANQSTGTSNANIKMTWQAKEEPGAADYFDLANNRFVAPADGWFEMTAAIVVEGGAGSGDDSMNWGAFVNGSWRYNVTDNWYRFSASGVENPRAATFSFNVNEGDIIEMYFSGVANNINILGNNTYWCGRFTRLHS